MRITLLRDVCGNTRDCPNINSTDRDSYVVQGYRVAGVLPPGQAMVEVPLSLLPELASAAPRDGLFLTDHGTVVVRGVQVADPDVLAELKLPAGENAVEIPRAVLPELEMVDAEQ